MAGQSRTPPVGVNWDTTAYIAGLNKELNDLASRKESDVKAAGIKWVTQAKQYAAVRTGFMKNNIVWEEGRDAKGYFVAVYCRAFYWKFVEFGTRYMAAQPFMRPAFAEALAYLRDRLKRA